MLQYFCRNIWLTPFLMLVAEWGGTVPCNMWYKFELLSCCSLGLCVCLSAGWDPAKEEDKRRNSNELRRETAHPRAFLCSFCFWTVFNSEALYRAPINRHQNGGFYRGQDSSLQAVESNGHPSSCRISWTVLILVRIRPKGDNSFNVNKLIVKIERKIGQCKSLTSHKSTLFNP